MNYKYETHLHTSEGSRCAKSTAAEMARSYKEQGYTGIFVTDHFFNGNCAVDKSLPWEEKVTLFCKGYENAKAEGDKIGLQVFFGFEYNTYGAELLVYNIDKEWLLAHPNIDKVDERTVFHQMRADGGFIIHAHPFRSNTLIKLFPSDIDGVEVYNGCQREGKIQNARAEQYALMYDLPPTAGSDSHHVDETFRCAVGTFKKILTPLDYLELLRNRELIIIC